MELLVVGIGSIVCRHIENLNKLLDNQLRVTALRKQQTPHPLVDHVVTDCGELEHAYFDVVIIASPASLHIEHAIWAVDRGWNIFVEKPLSNRMESVNDLIQRVDVGNLMALVGYQFRYYEPLKFVRKLIRDGMIGRVMSVRAEVGMYLPDWRPGKDYRESVSAQRKMGGGAVLELSHELDYLRWLLGPAKRVLATTRHASELEIDVEDLAEVLIDFESGVLASVHMDMVRRDAHRMFEAIGTHGTLRWDWATHEVSWTQDDGVTQNQEFKLERNAMYEAQMAHLLECLAGVSPKVPLREGAATLALVLAVHRSSKTETWAPIVPIP